MDTSNETPSAEMASLLSIDEQFGEIWTAGELAAIWKHQLQAPLLDELQETTADAEETLVDCSKTLDQPLSRFADLLTISNPPLELLALVKDFAKRQRQRKTLPLDIATGLYYLALGLADAKERVQISDLDDAAMIAGLDWLRAQPWLDAQSRTAVDAARRRLGLETP